MNGQPSHRLEKSDRGTDECNHDRDDQESSDDKQPPVRQLYSVAECEHSNTADEEEGGGSARHDRWDISFEQEGLKELGGFKSLAVDGQKADAQ